MLSLEAKKEALSIARNSIRDGFNNMFKPPIVNNKELLRRAGVFTTLWKDKELRGCIGELEQREVALNIYKSAQLAAFEDPRFYPLSIDEFDRIDIELSILTPFEPVAKPYEKNIEIGRDGLFVEYGFNRGLLLPQVATEYNMSVSEFLDSLANKAGLNRSDLKKANLYKFQAEVFKESEVFV